MVRQLLGVASLALVLFGCGDEIDKNAQKTEALTPEQQIEKIQNTTGMPDDVKEKTIAGLRQQIEAKKTAPAASN